MCIIDPLHYFVEGLTVNEMENLPIVCDDRDLVKFPPPTGQTCGEYLADFFNSGATGYLENPNATDMCGYCSFRSGEEFYSTSFGWSAANKWRNLGIIAGIAGFNILVFFGLCYLKRTARR